MITFMIPDGSRMASRTRMFAMCCLAVLTLTGCETGRRNQGEIVATVGDAELYEGQLRANLEEMGLDPDDDRLKGDYIDRWVDRRLLIQEARRRKLHRAPELEASIEKIREEMLIQSLYDDAYVSSEPTEEELLEYWTEHTGEFTRPTGEVKVIMVYAPSRQVAWRVRFGFDKATPGEELIEQYGDLAFDSTGWIRGSNLPRQVENELRKLRPGDPTQPFKYKDNWMVVKLVDRASAGSTRPLEEVRDEVRVRIRAKKRIRARIALLSDLRREARRNGLVTIPGNPAADTLQADTLQADEGQQSEEKEDTLATDQAE
ncbi:hypothetical protein GF324_10585 [bacterium]|nr:hypothetical protein [bacterium]